jgi:hypothetical protein
MKNQKKAIFMVLVMFCLHTTLFSQNINITKDYITVKNAMELLKKEYGYSFVFESADVNTQKIISIDIRNLSIDDAIIQVLQGQEVSYEIKRKNIIIKKLKARDPVSPMSGKTQRIITGTVLDELGEPVIGANVVEKETTNGITTDIDGEFSLNVGENAVLQISYIGYVPQEIPVKNRSELIVTL